jgi:hypothetical protein
VTIIGDGNPIRGPGNGGKVIWGSFTTDGAGAVSTSEGEGFTITKPAGTGIYRCTLKKPYYKIRSALAQTFSAATQETKVQAKVKTASTGVIDIQAYKGIEDLTTQFQKTAADGAAGDATTEFVFWRAPSACIITSAYLASTAGITGHADNHATIALAKRDGAGGGSTCVATFTTDTDVVGQGTVTALVPIAFANQALANRTLAAGNILTLAIAKGGTGVVIPVSTIVIHYTSVRDADLLSGGVEFTVWVKDTTAPK